jgi:hypothetical protein
MLRPLPRKQPGGRIAGHVRLHVQCSFRVRGRNPRIQGSFLLSALRHSISHFSSISPTFPHHPPRQSSYYLEQAMDSDFTKSWDVVFMRLPSWILQTVVNGRVGDVVITKGYDETKHSLFWSDLTIRMRPTGRLEGSLIKVVLRNSKSCK